MAAKTLVGFSLLALCSNAVAFHINLAPKSVRIGLTNTVGRSSIAPNISWRLPTTPSAFERLRGGIFVLKAEEEDPPPDSSNSSVFPVTECPVDFGAIGKYIAGTAVEFSIIMGLLSLLQAALLSRVGLKWARATVFFTFGFLAIKSRTFGVLDARRPNIGAEVEEKKERKRPDWMPPVKVFPVIWITIGILRAVSSTMVWEAMGNKLFTKPIAAMVLHLSVGDTWNHINNVEKRLGVAVPVVFLVWVTVANVVFRYFRVVPKAGLVILPSLIWISIANLLVQSIWRLNGKEPLYPSK